MTVPSRNQIRSLYRLHAPFSERIYGSNCDFDSFFKKERAFYIKERHTLFMFQFLIVLYQGLQWDIWQDASGWWHVGLSLIV